MSDLGRSPASYRGLLAHWQQHATSTPNRDLQNLPAQPGHYVQLTQHPPQQSPTVPDHGIRARTHHAGKRQQTQHGPILGQESQTAPAPVANRPAVITEDPGWTMTFTL